MKNRLDYTWFEREIVKRFKRYVQIDTTSDPHIEEIPSTPGQWNLIHLLENELREIGIMDIDVTANGYVLARLPARFNGTGPSGSANSGKDPRVPVIGLMAHVDTSFDMSGANVVPKVHENYEGQDIPLGDKYILSAREYPELLKYKGDTIITSDGTTLLGVDDKGGIAEIMTALTWLQQNSQVEHGEIEIIFTPDEETGKGMNLFPKDRLRSLCCYTVDGTEEGSIEAECFNAYRAQVICTGKVIHLGNARGRLINAVAMAGMFISLLPRNESPEATDERYGYYAPLEIKGSLEQAALEVFLRDFETEGAEKRIEALRKFAQAVEAAHPGGKVEVNVKKQYANMREYIKGDLRIMGLLEKAISKTGITPERKIIRGGTDGARLSEMGIPTPNIFTGCHNPHSRYEWAPVSAMVRASQSLVYLIKLWAAEKPDNS